MTSVTGEIGERFGHESRPQAVLLGDRLGHVLEEDVTVGGDETIGVLPIHFELAVRVFMVVLVGTPAKLQHRVADFADDVVVPHQCGLVVAGFGLAIALVGDAAPVGRDQEIFGLDAGFHRITELGGTRDLAFKHDTRRRRDLAPIHPQIRRQPRDLRLPRQPHQTIGVRHGEHIGVGGRHVEPGGKPGKPGASALHLTNRLCRDELGPQPAEKIDEADQEVFYFSLFGDFRQIDHRHASASLV